MSRWTVRRRRFDGVDESVRRCSLAPATVHPLRVNVDLLHATRPQGHKARGETDQRDEATTFVDPLRASLGGLSDGPVAPVSNGEADAVDARQSPIMLRTGKGTRLVNTLHANGPIEQDGDEYTPSEPADMRPSWAGRAHAAAAKCNTAKDKVAEMLGQRKSESDIVDKVQVAWAQDQRVESIKICIDAATSLSHCGGEDAYTAHFFTITEVLDSFGSLVLQRLVSKANAELRNRGQPAVSAAAIRCKAIPAAIHETASNWFYKVASIRELLPRIYLESCLLRCRRLVAASGTGSGRQRDPCDMDEHVLETAVRLVTQCRGIGDPLVAVHARCYVCRCALAARLPDAHRYMAVYWRALNDTVATWQGACAPRRAECAWPVLDYIVQCVGRLADTADCLAPLWAHCERSVDTRRLLLMPLLRALPAAALAPNALQLLHIVLADPMEASSLQCVPLSSLGRRCAECEPPPDVQRAVLSTAWLALAKYASVADFVRPAAAWATFACHRFGTGELAVLLEDIVRKVTPDQAFRDFYPELLELLDSIVKLQPDFYSLFALPHFVPFVDLFVDDQVRLKACRLLLDAFVSCRLRQSEISGDASLCNHMLSLCKSLHDTLNAASLRDEQLATGKLICGTLDKFTFDADHGHMLSVLVEARGSFCNMDGVTEYLIWRCNSLTSSAVAAGGRATRKRAQFVRACVAYAYITAPSLVEPIARLRLYVASAQVALAAACLSQAEAQLKAAITLVGQFDLTSRPKTSTQSARSLVAQQCDFVHTVRTLIAFLLAVPDPPESTKPLYLFAGLLAALDKVVWPADSDAYHMLMVDCVCWLSAAAQPVYPYHCGGVEANDALYGGDAAFIGHIDAAIERCLQPILHRLKWLGDTLPRRSALAGHLLQAAVAWLDPTCPKARAIIANLCNMTAGTPVGRAAVLTLRQLAAANDGSASTQLPQGL